MNTFGFRIHITFSGESHGDFLSVVMEGLPKGLRLNEEEIRKDLEKRRPKGDLATARREKDEYRIVSGLTDGCLDGSPLTFVVPNADVRPQDYDNLRSVPRPGHADYPAWVRDPDFFGHTGGGPYSGRLTVLFSIVGAIARQILAPKGIRIVSHFASVGGIEDLPLPAVHFSDELLSRLESAVFPLVDPSRENLMKDAVRAAKEASDTLGGIIESSILGVPAGYGEPWFDSVESLLSHLLFSIPAVKGVEFGDGFSFASHPGSEVKDEYELDPEGKIVTSANHNGGILGGLTTGMPIRIRTAIKPASSIGLPQRSVNLETREPAIVTVGGRHDPCIALRAIHVVNAVLWYGILEIMSERDLI